jgi:hypothetical protein
MPAKQQRSGAANAAAGDLVAIAEDPAAFDKMIAEVNAARESAHDRERQAVAAEKRLAETEAAIKVARQALERDAASIREGLAEREAACAEREAALQPREARLEKFHKMIRAA